MKRTAMALACVLAVGTAQPALADHGDDLIIEESIRLTSGGLLASSEYCDTGGTFQGFDGFWIRLPDDSDGHPFELGSTGDDVYLFFRDSHCLQIAIFQRQGSERGHVPPGSRWAFVTGAGFKQKVGFTFTVEGAG